MQLGLELDDESGGRLLADTGHHAQRIDVVGRERSMQLHRWMHRQNGQRQRRPDSVRRQQRFEADALVLAPKAVERLRVFAHVMMYVHEHFVTDGTDGRGQLGRGRDAIAHTTRFDDQFAIEAAVEQRATQ